VKTLRENPSLIVATSISVTFSEQHHQISKAVKPSCTRLPSNTATTMAVTTEPEEYVARDLFGGAITADLPTTFADVSDIRQVHDHQEVWLDRDGFTSVAIDILERVQEAGKS